MSPVTVSDMTRLTVDDLAERTLALDLTDRRLAALLLPFPFPLLPPLPYRRPVNAVAVSHSGNGPEIVGRPGTTPFFVFAFSFAGPPAGARVRAAPEVFEEAEE